VKPEIAVRIIHM